MWPNVWSAFWGGAFGAAAMKAVEWLAKLGLPMLQRWWAGRKAAEPEIEFEQDGQIEPGPIRHVFLTVRNRWRGSAVIERVAVLQPNHMRLQFDDRSLAPTQERSLQLKLEPIGTPFRESRGPRGGMWPTDSARLDFWFTADPTGALFATTITLQIDVRLKGANERVVTKKLNLPAVVPRCAQAN